MSQNLFLGNLYFINLSTSENARFFLLLCRTWILVFQNLWKKKRPARGPVYHKSLLAVQRITTIIQMVAIENVLCISKIVPAKGWQIKKKNKKLASFEI